LKIEVIPDKKYSSHARKAKSFFQWSSAENEEFDRRINRVWAFFREKETA
jgi:hypothetical protein